MAIKYCDSKVPETKHKKKDSVLHGAALKAISEVEASFDDMSLHRALIAIWEFINFTNKYIVEKEPWTLEKNPGNKEKLTAIMYDLLAALRAIAVLISPFMPQAAGKILRQIGVDESRQLDLDIVRRGDVLTMGSPLVRDQSLFPRIDTEKENNKMAKQEFLADLGQMIDYDQFAKVDLRVGKILEAEIVPQSNKLLKLKVDIGEERTIVAGIGKNYAPVELIGKKIVMIANLKPVQLMGIESHGMLLATDTDKGLTILTFDREAKTGAKIR
jgi:methionyl-tRNA synthetase